MKIPKGMLVGVASLLLVLAIVLYTFNNSASKRSQSEQITVQGGSTEVDTEVDTEVHTAVFSDVLMCDTIEELSSESDIIVIGEVIKKSDNTRNLARNPLNPGEYAKDRILMSQEYEFNVLEYYKGNGDRILNIVYPDYTEMINVKGTNIPEGTKFSSGVVPLIPGQKYVLFLKNGIDGTYYGPAEPWQFKIVDGNVQIISSEKDVKIRDLKEMTADELVLKLQSKNFQNGSKIAAHHQFENEAEIIDFVSQANDKLNMLSREKVFIQPFIATVTLSKALSFNEFEDFVLNYNLDICDYKIRALGKDGDRITVYVAPRDNMLFSRNEIINDAIGQNDLVGVIAFTCNVTKNNLNQIINMKNDNRVYVVDVDSYFIGKNIREQINKDIRANDIYWHLEDFQFIR